MNAMRPAPLWAALGLSLLALASTAQEKGKKKTDDGAKIKVAVEMVSLPVVVSTREGKLVTDLEKGDFQVFEDGVPQEIAGFSPTDEPISVALTIDTSGSTEARLAEMQNESIRFTELLHPDDSVAVLSFAEDVKLQKDFTIDRSVNARGIKQTRSGGSTVLYEAVWLALDEVLKPVQERKALVLFTDGVDTTSRKASQKETLELAKETRAAIYSIYFNTEYDVVRRGMPGTRPTVGGIPLPGGGPTIGGPPIYGPGRGGSWGEYAAGRRYLEELSELSGGRVFDALAMQDLGPAFEQIARELASQYSIGYYSTNTKTDGKFRKVEVRVKRPGLVARTKKGYYSRKPGK
jgi:VWFA-related protein